MVPGADSQELSSLGRLAAPVVLTYSLQMSLSLVTLFCVGHQGTPIDLAGAALGNLFCNVTGYTVGLGMATAMDTLCSQAHGQNSKSPLVGIIFQRGMAIMMVLCCPIIVLWWNSELILLWCGQHPEITSLAQNFCRWMIPGLPGYLIFECFKKYLHTQGIVSETVYALLGGSLLNVYFHYFFIYKQGWGFSGAAIALSLTYITLPLILLYFVKRSGCHKSTWYGWSSQAFSDWGPFLKLGVPGLLMVCAEWWAAEVIALAAGFIGDNDLAAQSIVTTINSMVFMIPLGISVAVNTRVGNLLGGGYPDRAKKSALLAIGVNLLCCLVNFVLLITLRHVCGYLLTNDKDVADLVSRLLLIYALAQIFDGTQGVEGGVLRALGKQTVGSVLNFVSYYIIGVPLALTLAFHFDQGIFGLWWGMCLGYMCCTALYTQQILSADWKKESIGAQERVRLELEKLRDDVGNVAGSANHRRRDDIEAQGTDPRRHW